MSELILGPLWGLQNEEEGQHQEVPLGPNRAGGQARHRAQRTPRHLWPRWGQPTTPHLSTSLSAQEKPQALAQRHGGGHIDSIWSLLACQQGPVASLLRPGARGEGMGSGPRALCLMRAPALCVYLTPRALGHFLSRTESKVPTPCRLCVASTNIAAQIQPLGCLLYVTHSPRAAAGRQRGGDAGRDRQKPPRIARLVDRRMLETQFRPDGPLPPAWCYQCTTGLPGGTQQPSVPAQTRPHFPEAVMGKGSSFPSSSTENMTLPQLPRGGSVSCSG